MKKLGIFLFLCVNVATIAGAQENVTAQPPVEKKSGITFRGLQSVDTFNVTYGNFSPFNGEENERHGEFVNVKARIRPFRVGKTDIGVSFTYTSGNSDSYRAQDDRWSYYDYTIWGAGVSGVYHHTNASESELEVGLLHQETDGWIPTKDFRSHQDETQWEFRGKYSNDKRRSVGELWAPHWEIGAKYVHPFDVSYSDTNGRGDDYAYDNRRFNVLAQMDIYDWYLGCNDVWRITPTANIMPGYIWGKDSGFIQSGFGFKLAAYEQEIFDIKLFNPRWMFESNGSRLYDFIGTWKVDNTIRAIWAAQTETYVSQDELALATQ